MSELELIIKRHPNIRQAVVCRNTAWLRQLLRQTNRKLALETRPQTITILKERRKLLHNALRRVHNERNATRQVKRELYPLVDQLARLGDDVVTLSDRVMLQSRVKRMVYQLADYYTNYVYLPGQIPRMPGHVANKLEKQVDMFG